MIRAWAMVLLLGTQLLGGCAGPAAPPESVGGGTGGDGGDGLPPPRVVTLRFGEVEIKATDLAGCEAAPPPMRPVPREWDRAAWLASHRKPTAVTAQAGDPEPRAFEGKDWPAEIAGYRAAWQQVFGPIPGGRQCIDLREEPLDVTPEGKRRLEELREIENNERIDFHQIIPVELRDNALFTDAYAMKKVSYRGHHGQRIPAYLLVPHRITAPRPAVLVVHQAHYACGKKEPAGVCRLPAEACPPPFCPVDGTWNMDFAARLATRGYIVLAPDSAGFGERVSPSGHFFWEYEETADLLAYLHPDTTMMGVRIGDAGRAIDVLQSLSVVAPDRIGMMGHGNGATETLFTAAMDPRVRAAISNAGPNLLRRFKVLETLQDPVPKSAVMPIWVDYGMIPALGYYAADEAQMPVEVHQLYAMIAPRALYLILLEDDTAQPIFDRVDWTFAETRRAYAALGGAFASYKVASTITAECKARERFPWSACRSDHAWYGFWYEDQVFAWLGEQLGMQ